MSHPTIHLLAVERKGWRRWLFGRWVHSAEPFRRDLQRQCAASDLQMLLREYETLGPEWEERMGASNYPIADRTQQDRQQAWKPETRSMDARIDLARRHFAKAQHQAYGPDGSPIDEESEGANGRG